MTAKNTTERREWKTPRVRTVVPASRTRGGVRPSIFVENAFYTIS